MPKLRKKLSTEALEASIEAKKKAGMSDVPDEKPTDPKEVEKGIQWNMIERYDNEYYGVGTGFKFQDISSKALYDTIGWANATYFDRPAHIRFMRHLAMRQNYSWSKSSQDYKQLYLKMSGGS